MPTSGLSWQFDRVASFWKRLRSRCKRRFWRVIAPICRWWQPIADKGKRDRRNDRALGLIVCNIIFLVFVLICFACGVQGELKGAPKKLELYFAGGEGVIMVAYASNAWMSRTLHLQLVRAMGWKNIQIPERPSGFSVPIEAFGVMNSFIVGFITYFTGGPSNSPYAQVLVAMLLIAEQTRTIHEPDAEEKLERVITQPFKEFRTFLLITAAFYLVLGGLQWKAPISAKTAPAGVSIAITLIIFMVGTITTYVSASSRTRHASSRDEAAGGGEIDESDRPVADGEAAEGDGLALSDDAADNGGRAASGETTTSSEA